MNKEVKEELTVVLELLKASLIRNHVSMATDKNGNIYFFDTDTYLNTKKMSGFNINIKDMVEK